MPLHLLDNSPDPPAIPALESVARSLRVLEIEARSLGSDGADDLLLTKTTQAVTADILRKIIITANATPSDQRMWTLKGD